MTPKWCWTLEGQRHPRYITYDKYPQFQILIVLLYGELFLGYKPFETSALNDPKMILNTKTSKVPHIHVTTSPESQISPRFTLCSSVFELRAILRQVHQMTQNDLQH